MKYLITGASGLLGQDIIKELLNQGVLPQNIYGGTSKTFDITNIKKINKVITEFQPDVIIHCAAYTNTEQAEKDFELAHNINVIGTENLIKNIQNTNVKFFFISSDYVFDDTNFKEYFPDDKTHALNVYGKTKILGENIVRKYPNSFIIRTAWLFGLGGENFINTMLDVAQSQKQAQVVSDQIGSPTSTSDLAKTLIDMANTNKYGTYHVVNEGFVDRASFVRYIYQKQNLLVGIKNILTENTSSKIKRPLNTKLNTDNLTKNGFSKLPSWQEATDEYLEKLQTQNFRYNNYPNYLVTGGVGFIGSNFLLYMTAKYPDINFICLDKLTYAGDFNNIIPLLNLPNFKFIKGDITDPVLVDSLFKKHDFTKVINFAAESHVDNSIANPSVFLKTNILGTQNLMDACLKYKVPHFHQISTDEVYGDLGLNNTEKFNKNSLVKPSNPYAVSKASADMLVKSYAHTYGLNYTISRCSNNYGPKQDVEKLIPMCISKALQNEPILLHGDGSSVRDWICVEDHVKAIDLILHQAEFGSLYNLGGNYQCSNLEVAKTILKYLKKDLSLLKFITDRQGQDQRYAMDYSKIQKELGWQPQENFEDKIKETIEYYKKMTYKK